VVVKVSQALLPTPGRLSSLTLGAITDSNQDLPAETFTPLNITHQTDIDNCQALSVRF
jgi:hypothetical protein